MKYKQGEIVLAQFPFTDGSVTKLRPVLNSYGNISSSQRLSRNVYLFANSIN